MRGRSSGSGSVEEDEGARMLVRYGGAAGLDRAEVGVMRPLYEEEDDLAMVQRHIDIEHAYNSGVQDGLTIIGQFGNRGADIINTQIDSATVNFYVNNPNLDGYDSEVMDAYRRGLYEAIDAGY